MAKQLKTDLQTPVGNPTFSKKLNAADFFDDQFGLPTVQDIIFELAKPGRDPRREFRVVKFNDRPPIGMRKLLCHHPVSIQRFVDRRNHLVRIAQMIATQEFDNL